MATKKEIKSFLKETGYSESDMQSFWDNLIETNMLVKKLNSCGKNWTDMNMSCIRDLPTRKQKDEENRAKREEENRLEEERLAKEKADAEYYNEHFEEIMVKKIDSGEELTEDELSTLAWEYEEERQHGDNRRWTRSVTSIIKLCDRFFQLNWEEGLTEYQPNEYYHQPCEVKKVEREEVIKVVQWVPVKSEKSK